MSALEIHPELIDPELLPYSLRELSTVIGVEATLTLSATYPSVPLYVPSVMKEGHILADLIGVEAFSKLVEHYGGDTLTIAKVDAAKRQIKHHILKRMKQEKISNRVIALHLDYSQRHVERLTSKMKDEDQFDLFGD